MQMNGLRAYLHHKKNGVFTSVHNDGIGCRFVYTELKRK